MDSQHFILGRRVEDFERKLRGVRRIAPRGWRRIGSDALLLALLALGVVRATR